METVDVFVVVDVFAAVVEAALTFVAVFEFVVLAGWDAGTGEVAAGAGAAGSRVRVVTDGGFATVTLVVDFDGTPGSSATAWLFVPTQSAAGALFTVTTGASLLSAECATPADIAADATMMANAAARRTNRLVLIHSIPPDRRSLNGLTRRTLRGTGNVPRDHEASLTLS